MREVKFKSLNSFRFDFECEDSMEESNTGPRAMFCIVASVSVTTVYSIVATAQCRAAKCYGMCMYVYVCAVASCKEQKQHVDSSFAFIQFFLLSA